MRIAVVSTPFIKVPPEGYGGTELFCGELAKGLVARGHDVTLFATGDSASHARVRAHFATARWPPSAADDVTHCAWALQEIVQDPRGYDIVQVNSWPIVPMMRLVDVQVVCTIHLDREEPLAELFRTHPTPKYVGISARQLERYGGLAGAEVIHHGIDGANYPVSLQEDGYLLHLGRFCEEKGTHLAIDAAVLAKRVLKLAGRVHPADAATYERVIAPRLRLPEVEVVGEVDHRHKVPLLQRARAMLCPLQWEEPFGLVALEAMMCGTPVIGFPRGSFPEIIDEGVTGFLVQNASEMARVATELEGFDRAACAARARERFGVDKMVDAYEALFERVIAARSRQPPGSSAPGSGGSSTRPASSTRPC